MTLVLRPYQLDVVERILERGNLLMAIQMGGGKAQPLSEPVRTPTGWVAMGDICVGDAVVGVDGLPTEVMGVFPQGIQPVYRVTFNDGSWTRCNEEHLWFVNHVRNQTPKLLTVRELLHKGLVDSSGNRNWRVPMGAAVCSPSVPVLIDPYLLGLLLGDGGMTTRTLIMSSVDSEILDSVKDLMPEGMCLNRGSLTSCDYRLVYPLARHNPLIAHLRTLGLMGKGSRTKFIPKDYLLGSVDQRVSLLQGLMDTDGYLATRGQGAVFCTTSPYLRDGVIELVESLGGTARLAGRSHPNGPSWRIQTKLPASINPFRLSRKANLLAAVTKYPVTRLISAIERDGEEEQQCISVSSPDGLYLTRHHLVTHNTIATIIAVRKLRQQRRIDHCCVFASKSTKYQWVEEIRKADPRASVQVISGDKTKRFYAYKQADQFQYSILSYEYLIFDWREIKLYLPVDAIVCDEISVLRGMTAKRTKRMKILGKKCEYRIGLSGQPVENRPEELFSIMEFLDPTVLGNFEMFDRTFIVRDPWGRPKRYRNLPLIKERMGEAMFRRSREEIAEWLPERVESALPVVLDAHTMKLHDLVKADLKAAIDAAVDAGYGEGGFNVAAHYGRSSEHRASMMGDVMSRLLAMRMLSSHPKLLLHSANEFDNVLTKQGSKYASALKERGKLDQLPVTNAKLEALIEHVQEIVDEDPRNKVVVFSYFKPMLKMIGTELDKSRIPYVVINGDVSAKQRFERITQFNTDLSTRVFLSSDAGAYGVDLNQGSHLINYDLPWSGGAYAQRISRIDRTNSAFRSINIFSMYGVNTLEERMFHMLVQKGKIAKAWIDGAYNEVTGDLKLDLPSLREFLDG